jgi:hypothetical protein
VIETLPSGDMGKKKGRKPFPHLKNKLLQDFEQNEENGYQVPTTTKQR